MKRVNPATKTTYGKWIKVNATAVKLNRNGSVSIKGPKSQKNRSVADGFVDSSGRFHPIRWAVDYSPSYASEEGEYHIHPSAKYYRKWGIKPPKKRRRTAAKASKRRRR